MLTRAELVKYEQALRGTKVLSVYITAWADDPARRDAWRIELKNELERKREELRTADHAEREAYGACVKRVWEFLDDTPGVVGDPGWVAFVTPEGMQFAESVSVDVPTRVEWGEGMQLAPYMRVLKQCAPAVVTVVDAREARLFRYRGDRIDKIGTLKSHKHVESPQHMGDAPKLGFHSGTRGTAGSDEADRARLAGRDVMIGDLIDRLLNESKPDAWILIGGISEVVDAVLNAMPERERSRTRRLAPLDAHATPAQIAAAAERGVTEASRERDAAVVAEIIALSGSYGKGLVGREGTLEALRENAVNRLCFTDSFLRSHPVEVERAVALALDEGAEVEHVSGAGAERLDAEGEGIGVRLRFLPTWEQTPMAASSETM